MTLPLLRDSNSRPIEFYHGTDTNFDAFDTLSACRCVPHVTHRGFFFSRSMEYAAKYGDIIVVAHLAAANARKMGGREMEDFEFHRLLRDRDTYIRQGIDCLFMDDPSDPDFLSEYVVFHPEQVRIVRRAVIV